MKKENLIILPSFATNSVLLSSLTEYLSKYFNAVFLDLPGFIKDIPPIKDEDIEHFAKYLDAKIKELNFDSFILCTICLSTSIIGRIKLDKTRCRGIICIHPYVNKRSLKLSHITQLSMLVGMSIAHKLKIYNPLWRTLRKKEFRKLDKLPQKNAEIMYENEDPRSFLEAGISFLTYKGNYWNKNIPHVLVANINDPIISYYENLKFFTQNLDQVLIINTHVEHYPKHLSEKYLEHKFSEETVKEIVRYFER